METIESVDQNLSSYVDSVKSIASKLEFTENFQFVLSDSIPTSQWESIVYPGIYLIEIKNDFKFESFDLWIENFAALWEDEEFKYKFVPGLKKKRIKQHVSLNEWIPLYIGKSKNIGARFKEHLYLELKRNTFALKLHSRSQFHKDVFRLSTIKVQVRNYDQILPIIENTLRNMINPIIGKQ